MFQFEDKSCNLNSLSDHSSSSSSSSSIVVVVVVGVVVVVVVLVVVIIIVVIVEEVEEVVVVVDQICTCVFPQPCVSLNTLENLGIQSMSPQKRAQSIA